MVSSINYYYLSYKDKLVAAVVALLVQCQYIYILYNGNNINNIQEEI